MRRRDFITLLGGAAALWPLAARAQQPERMRRIAVLLAGDATDPQWQGNLAAFQEGLAKLGWTVGRNLVIDTRSRMNDVERTSAVTAELLRSSPDVIVAERLDLIYAFLPTPTTLAALLLPPRLKTKLVFGLRAGGVRPDRYDMLNAARRVTTSKTRSRMGCGRSPTAGSAAILNSPP
jgi:hypothetical protein